MLIVRYLAALKTGKVVLWCYLIWYLVTVYFYFDSALPLWLNSLGISLVIGVALMLSVSPAVDNAASSTLTAKAPRDYWQTFRLFMMPFGVSSFSSLIKGQGFIFIVPPLLSQLAIYAGSCLMFIGIVLLLKYFYFRYDLLLMG